MQQRICDLKGNDRRKSQGNFWYLVLSYLRLEEISDFEGNHPVNHQNSLKSQPWNNRGIKYHRCLYNMGWFRRMRGIFGRGVAQSWLGAEVPQLRQKFHTWLGAPSHLGHHRCPKFKIDLPQIFAWYLRSTSSKMEESLVFYLLAN